mgnify:CR=1 FL=1
MKKDDIILIGQLLSAMSDSVEKMEEAIKNGDSEKLNYLKGTPGMSGFLVYQQ